MDRGHEVNCKPGEKAEGFMCLIDAQHHVPDDANGVKIFFDLGDLKAAHPHAFTSCGVAKVNIEFVEILVEQDLMNGAKSAKELLEEKQVPESGL
jgi:hypothetical protein